MGGPLRLKVWKRKMISFSFFSAPNVYLKKLISQTGISKMIFVFEAYTQLTFTCSNSSIEALEKDVKYVQN